MARPECSRAQVRVNRLGMTSIARTLKLHPHRCYQRLLKHWRSGGIKLAALRLLWRRAIISLFAGWVKRLDGRPTMITGGKNVAKSGKRC